MLSKEQKLLIDEAVTKVAVQLAKQMTKGSSVKDLYVLQDYLGDFDCDGLGLTYPNGTKQSMEQLSLKED